MKKLWAIAFLPFLLACNDKVPEPTPVEKKAECTMQPTFGATPLALNQTFTLSDGTLVEFTDIKCYFSDVTSNGNTLVSSAFFNFAEKGTSFFSVTDNNLALSGLNFGLGVAPSVNHNDPSAFPSSNPLNIAIANDMHWSWNTGYIFIKVEGRADTLVDGTVNCNHLFSYHVGGDYFYLPNQSVSGTWTTVSDVNKRLQLKLDLKTFFENAASPINVRTEFMTHSPSAADVLGAKVKTNFMAAIAAL